MSIDVLNLYISVQKFNQKLQVFKFTKLRKIQYSYM